MGLAYLLAFLFACAANNRPLITRGITDEERRFYIIQNGYGIEPEIRQAFLEGELKLGMNKDLVFQMYGAPDRTRKDNTVWEYVNRGGQVVTGLKFEADSLAEIYGDPTGGKAAAAAQ